MKEDIEDLIRRVKDEYRIEKDMRERLEGMATFMEDKAEKCNKWFEIGLRKKYLNYADAFWRAHEMVNRLVEKKYHREEVEKIKEKLI